MAITRDLPFTQISKSYSKYHHRGMKTQSQRLFDKLNQGPIDSKDALKIEDRNDLLNPGYLPAEIGYCIMPDGTGFVSSIIQMRNITPIMFDWWFAWHGLQPLRYRIWDKDNHFNIDTTKREQLLNPNLSLKEKLWGVTHTVTEDRGFGAERTKINFMSPGQLGFDINRFKEPYVSSVVGGNTNYAVMCHFIRKIEDGIELRSRFWMGYQIINRNSVKTLPAGTKISNESAKVLALCNIKKFTNLAKLLPSIYYEERNKW